MRPETPAAIPAHPGETESYMERTFRHVPALADLHAMTGPVSLASGKAR